MWNLFCGQSHFFTLELPTNRKSRLFWDSGKIGQKVKKNRDFLRLWDEPDQYSGIEVELCFFFWSCDFEIWEWLFRIRRKSITITSTIYDIESNICMGCTILALKFSFLKDYEFFSTLNSIISRTVLNHMVGTKVIAQKTLFMLINSLTEIVSFTTYS